MEKCKRCGREENSCVHSDVLAINQDYHAFEPETPEAIGADTWVAIIKTRSHGNAGLKFRDLEPEIQQLIRDGQELPMVKAELDALKAALEKEHELYQMAVKGRAEFRKAFKQHREKPHDCGQCPPHDFRSLCACCGISEEAAT